MYMRLKHTSPSTLVNSRFESGFCCASGISPLLRSRRCRNHRLTLGPSAWRKAVSPSRPAFLSLSRVRSLRRLREHRSEVFARYLHLFVNHRGNQGAVAVRESVVCRPGQRDVAQRGVYLRTLDQTRVGKVASAESNGPVSRGAASASWHLSASPSRRCGAAPAQASAIAGTRLIACSSAKPLNMTVFCS